MIYKKIVEITRIQQKGDFGMRDSVLAWEAIDLNKKKVSTSSKKNEFKNYNGINPKQ